MIPKKCKICTHFLEVVAERFEGQKEWTRFDPSKKQCTMSDDGRFHFNYDDFEENWI